VMLSSIFSIITPVFSVTCHWFAAQETFLINVEKSCFVTKKLTFDQCNATLL